MQQQRKRFFLLLIFLHLMSSPLVAMEEKLLPTLFESDVMAYFSTTFKQGRFEGAHGVQLRYISPREKKGENVLIILGGRTEFIEKYAELIFDLGTFDISIYSFDFRGQGMSGRLLADSQKGHVAKFEDYVDDLKIFIDKVVSPQENSNIFILSHSMGGTVATLFQQQYPGVLKGMVLVSPMFSIETSPLPQKLVQWLAAAAVSFGFGDRYIFGGTPFNEKPSFEHNDLTSSEIRFNLNHGLMLENTKISLGSPTFKWLTEAFRAMKRLMVSAERVEIPILLLQSGDDKVVGLAAQKELCKKSENCQLKTITAARHELLMERDSMRLQAIKAIETFLLENR